MVVEDRWVGMAEADEDEGFVVEADKGNRQRPKSVGMRTRGDVQHRWLELGAWDGDEGPWLELVVEARAGMVARGKGEWQQRAGA